MKGPAQVVLSEDMIVSKHSSRVVLGSRKAVTRRNPNAMGIIQSECLWFFLKVI